MDQYQQELADAEIAGFVPGALMTHYKTHDTYRVLREFTITDNSEFDGRPGLLYVAQTGASAGRVFGRPAVQVCEKFDAEDMS